MSKQAIIDLGSNTVRLVIYEIADALFAMTDSKTDSKSAGKAKGQITADDFTEIINEKKVCGLSAYVENEELSKAGLEKAADALTELLAIAEAMQCEGVRIFATAVVRNCRNRDEIVKELERATSVPIEVLSEIDESHLGFVGATLSAPIKNGVLIDVGGGSSELTLVRKGKEAFNSSLDIGSVSAFACCVNLLIPTKSERKKICTVFDYKLDRLSILKEAESPVLYGIGGSARALGKMRARMLGSDKALKVLSRDDVRSILELADSDPSAFIHTAAKATPDRMHTLLTGCTIIDRAMERLGTEELQLCKGGVREGFLVDRCL